MTAKSAESFKLPVICHPIFILIVWVPCVLVGVWAYAAYSGNGIVWDGTDFPLIPGTEKVNANAVLPFLVKEKTGMILAGFLAAGILGGNHVEFG